LALPFFLCSIIDLQLKYATKEAGPFSEPAFDVQEL
jgi:hypothetical protein